MRHRLQGRYNNCQARRGGYHPPVCPRNRWLRGARQGELPQRGKRRCPGVRLGAPNGAPAATQQSGRRGEKEAQRMIRSLGRRCRGDLWSPAQWRPGLPAGACAAGAPISSRRNGEKEGPGGLRPPWTPQYGGSRRQALYGPGKNRACIHARFLFVSVTGAAAPWVARVDHPAGPDSRCAVPAWPAGPPSVLCRRNTLAVTAAHSMFGPCTPVGRGLAPAARFVYAAGPAVPATTRAGRLQIGRAHV